MASNTNPTLLDRLGLSLAICMGAAVFIFGSQSMFWIFLLFLVLSVGVTKYGFAIKREIGLYEHERSWENVLANGLVPTIAAVASGYIGWGAYIGSVAAITADKFASELGVLGGEPISLLTLKKGRRGESGCVSVLGTLMSLDGALLIGLGYFALNPGAGVWIVVKIGLIGFAGSLADSIAGVLEERGVGTKATTNVICSLVGALFGYAFLAHQ
jgi:uncharacterized protein (TIGR00297 family)